MNYELRTNKAFTLIELVVAIAILVIVITFAGVIFKVGINSHRTAAANAEIIITEKIDVLVIPERLVTFAEDSTFVDVKDSAGVISQLPVEVGLSDGINIEVIAGLDEGQEIIERPPRTIE